MRLDGYIAGPNGGEYDCILMDRDIDFPGTQGQFDTFLHAARSYASLDGHAALAVAGGDTETLFRLALLTDEERVQDVERGQLVHRDKHEQHPLARSQWLPEFGPLAARRRRPVGECAAVARLTALLTHRPDPLSVVHYVYSDGVVRSPGTLRLTALRPELTVSRAERTRTGCSPGLDAALA